MRSGIGISLYRIVPIVPPHCAHNSFCCCCCVLFCVLRVSKRGEWMISCCHRTSCKRLHCSGGIIGMNVGQCFRLCNGNYTVSDDDYSAAKRLISFACSPTLVFITFIRPRIVDGGCYRTFIESSNTFSQRHSRNIYLKWCNVHAIKMIERDKNHIWSGRLLGSRRPNMATSMPLLTRTLCQSGAFLILDSMGSVARDEYIIMW